MADYYCDHGAYPAYAATPTWNTAQEGDGKATGLATPAIASFLINAVAVAGNTIAIAGVTLTAVASGATATQFNVGATTTAQADNIAAAINAATATVGASVATGTPQLRNLMYARGPSNGAPANTVQIMTRCGSADFNYASNTNMALASAGWGTPPTITQFSGGTSGVWGYLINDVTLWPSAVAAGSYGVYKSGSNAQPMHGPATLDWYADTVYSRCRGQTFIQPSNNQWTITRTNLSIVYDDGSGVVPAWSGDTGVFTYRIVIVGANNVGRKATGAIRFAERSLTFGRFTIEVDTGLTSGLLNGLFNSDAAGGETLAENIKVLFTNISSGATQYVAQVLNSGKTTVRGCKIYWPNNTIPAFTYVNSSAQNEFVMENCDIVYTGSPPSPVAAFMAINANDSSKFVFRNVRSIGLPAPQKLVSMTPTSTSRIVIIGDSCEGFDVPATLVGYVGSLSTQAAEIMYMLLYNMGAKRGFTFECPQGYLQWWDSQDYPTYSARLPDGSYWSLRFRWLSSVMYGPSAGRPLTLWRQSMSVLTTGKQTVTAEFLVDPTYASAITKGHIGLNVGYVSNVTSGRKYATSLESTTKNALAASTAAWTLGSTYNGYTKVKVAVTLPDAIKQYTEIECALVAVRPAPTADQYVFIDPEVALS